MKRFIVLSLLMACVFAVKAQETQSAFISDGSGVKTNIRNRPKGAVVMSLQPSVSYAFNLATPKNGWWKIISVWNEEDEDDTTARLDGSDTGEYWIHYSVIGVYTSNYGGQRLLLRNAPNAKAKVVYSFTEEIELRPMDIQNGWVKVKANNGKVGWIEQKWLCANTLTNCC